jgi:hypothetical protein
MKDFAERTAPADKGYTVFDASWPNLKGSDRRIGVPPARLKDLRNMNVREVHSRLGKPLKPARRTGVERLRFANTTNVASGLIAGRILGMK